MIYGDHALFRGALGAVCGRRVVACVCEEKLTAFAAVSCARAFAKDGRGAIAFSQRCDEALHGCEPRQVIAGFGQMPESVETFLQRLELGRG